MTRLFNPPGMAAPQAAYSHGALVTAGSDLLFVAGQLGVKPDGLLGVGFDEQAEWAFRNVVTVLESQGMSPANLVKIQMFITEVEQRVPLQAAIKKAFGDAKPVSTLLVVKSLARPEFLIEVEAVAARAPL